MNGMLWVDIAILVIIAVSGLISILRGLIKEVLSLVAWVLAIWVGITFADQVAVLLVEHISMPSARLFLGFLGLFMCTLVVMGIVNHLIGKLVESTGLSGTDRALGMLFGIIRGIAIVAVLVLLAGFTPVPQDLWWHESMFIGHFQELALMIRPYLPDEIAQHLSYE